MSVAAGPRVVFLPGVMGTVLVDGSLTPAQARAECRRNLGFVADRALRGSALYPCDKRPETLWGNVGSLHWLFAPTAWQRRMTAGNGYDLSGQVRPDGLLDIDIRFAGRRFAFQPYTSLIKALRDAGCDVLVFDYDWRLSNRHNASVLYRRILSRWFGGRQPAGAEKMAGHERITLIGHSMGGLIARCLVENAAPAAHLLIRRVITIGTPHLGAPQSYLHLTGRTLPLPENPFYRWSQAIVGQRMAASGATAQSGVGAQFLPARVQTAVLAHTASAFELLPTYDFVTSRGRTESRVDSYRSLTHTGTGRPASRLVDEFHRGLVPIPRLAEWLRQHRVDYHLLAATGFSTTVGYERDRDRIVTALQGDQTVPLTSARPVPRSVGNLHVETFGTAGGQSHQQGHQLLCQRADVQAYCLRVLTGGTAPSRGPSGGATAPSRASTGITGARPFRPVGLQPDDLVAVARIILRGAPPYRGKVLSVVRLLAATGTQLIDTTTEPSSRPRGVRLKNPPKHLSSPDVFEVRTPRHGTLRYVWMLSSEKAAFGSGGILFLPRAGNENLVYLVTFNTGQLDTRVCKNDHHAETQMTGWFDAQPPSWRAQVENILVQNRSRQTGPRGYSPCNACCVDLANFLIRLKAVRGGRGVQAGISWLEVYEGGAACGHPTDTANLRRLATSGWVLGGPRPTQRELSLTAASW